MECWIIETKSLSICMLTIRLQINGFFIQNMSSTQYTTVKIRFTLLQFIYHFFMWWENCLFVRVSNGRHSSNWNHSPLVLTSVALQGGQFWSSLGITVCVSYSCTNLGVISAQTSERNNFFLHNHFLTPFDFNFLNYDSPTHTRLGSGSCDTWRTPNSFAYLIFTLRIGNDCLNIKD